MKTITKILIYLSVITFTASLFWESFITSYGGDLAGIVGLFVSLPLFAIGLILGMIYYFSSNFKKEPADSNLSESNIKRMNLPLTITLLVGISFIVLIVIPIVLAIFL